MSVGKCVRAHMSQHTTVCVSLCRLLSSKGCFCLSGCGTPGYFKLFLVYWHFFLTPFPYSLPPLGMPREDEGWALALGLRWRRRWGETSACSCRKSQRGNSTHHSQPASVQPTARSHWQTAVPLGICTDGWETRRQRTSLADVYTQK